MALLVAGTAGGLTTAGELAGAAAVGACPELAGALVTGELCTVLLGVGDEGEGEGEGEEGDVSWA